MSRYITKDFKCPDCGNKEIIMLDRDNQDIPQICNCGSTMNKLISANICSVSYPDGTTNRFKSVKEQRRIKLAMREARKIKNKEEQQYLKTQLEDVRVGSRKDRQVENICKKKPEE